MSALKTPVLLILAAVVLAPTASARDSYEPTGTLGVIAGVPVLCLDRPGAFYDIGHQQIVIAQQDCDLLRSATQPGQRWGFYRHETWLVVTTMFRLAHEEGHAHDPELYLRTTYSPLTAYIETCNGAGPCESFADCWGAQHYRSLARMLGFSGYNARRFTRLARSYSQSLSYEPVPQQCWQ